jgi:hypothetical protein
MTTFVVYLSDYGEKAKWFLEDLFNAEVGVEHNAHRRFVRANGIFVYGISVSQSSISIPPIIDYYVEDVEHFFLSDEMNVQYRNAIDFIKTRFRPWSKIITKEDVKSLIREEMNRKNKDSK